MVFGTQQKFAADGEFELIDVWFLRQLARTCVLQLLLRAGPGNATAGAKRLGVETGYYHSFPTEPELTALLGGIRDRLNAPLSLGVAAYDWWSAALELDATPPNASGLPFASLLPEPAA